jgi:hypothetical protein
LGLSRLRNDEQRGRGFSDFAALAKCSSCLAQVKKPLDTAIARFVALCIFFTIRTTTFRTFFTTLWQALNPPAKMNSDSAEAVTKCNGLVTQPPLESNQALDPDQAG